MIAKGNPWQLKLRPKDGALHFDSNGNMLYVGEQDENGRIGSRWAMWCRSMIGHGISDVTRSFEGNPYGGGIRLQGLKG
jgi:hypothetical protein